MMGSRSGPGMIHYQLRCGQAWVRWLVQRQRQLRKAGEAWPDRVSRMRRDRYRAGADGAGFGEAGDACRCRSRRPRSRRPPLLPVPRRAKLGRTLPAQMMAALQRMRAEIEKNCDYVGPDFAEQARAMHRGEIEPRASTARPPTSRRKAWPRRVLPLPKSPGCRAPTGRRSIASGFGWRKLLRMGRRGPWRLVRR